MSWLIDNFSVLIGLIAVLVIVILAVKWFINLAKDKQIEKIREWLLYACTIAEKELGSGTGQVKLRYVYDMFLEKFKFMSMLITFDKFSNLVDNSLDILKEMLKSNANLKRLIKEGK